MFRLLSLGFCAVGLVVALPAPPACASESPPRDAVPLPQSIGTTPADLPPITSHIHVDQFGYLPDEQKVAVVSDPRIGFNADDHFVPGPALEVRRVVDGDVVHRGAPQWFAEGCTDAASGDRGWWFDFSTVTQQGGYYIYDPKSGVRSDVFRIAPDVYASVLQAAMRVFYYQRAAAPHTAPWAEAPWQDGPSFLQDREARAVWAKDDPATARDMSGGWMDAGDTNKYPPFLDEVVHPLLYAWRANPAVFTDDFNIPESGNNLPDLLDEVKWELDWLAKMQDADGGVFIKIGMPRGIDATAPYSEDRQPRYYAPKCSGSTIVSAGVFAHAARVYGTFATWKEFAAGMRERAERAWQWYKSNPRCYHCDDRAVMSGFANMNAARQDAAEAISAMHLWALTGKEEYHEAFRTQVGTLRQLSEPVWSHYRMGQAEALFDYRRQPNADRAIVDRIVAAYTQALNSPQLLPQGNQCGLYRAWMPDGSFLWGSSRNRACYGIAALGGVDDANLGGTRGMDLRQRALNLLHAFHGVNPLNFVYLTNMGGHGAASSSRQIYHERFGDNPPPGYVVGGPNTTYHGDLALIRQQPPEKAYADGNKSKGSRFFELSEPAIYYQADYIRLLAPFVAPRH